MGLLSWHGLSWHGWPIRQLRNLVFISHPFAPAKIAIGVEFASILRLLQPGPRGNEKGVALLSRIERLSWPKSPSVPSG